MPSIYCFVFMYFISFIFVMGGEDWFLVWMGLEINMMSFLILIYRRYSMSVIESCLKYFFIQSLGSALLISMFYLNNYMLGGISFLILSFKIGAGPFFYWFPSMCSGIEWVSCMMLMILQKFLPLLLIEMFIHWILWYVVVISLVMGILGSFNQSNIKQLMAYSSIHHLGWIMLMMESGGMSWILYLFMYSLVLISVVGLLVKDDIVDFSTMFTSKNSVMFMIGMLSMAGIPPLLGFFLKWMALIKIIEVSMMYLVMLIVVSIVMLYIYMRIVYNIFMGGGMEVCEDIIMFKKNLNIEIMSVMGIMMGVIFGFMIMM